MEPRDTLQLQPEADDAILVMENVSTIDRSVYFQAVQARGRSWKMWLFCVLGILLVPVGLIMYQHWVWICGLTIAVLSMFYHVILGHRDYGKLCQYHPEGVWQKTVRFYEDRIETDSGMGRVTVAYYRHIRRRRITDTLILLDFGRHAPATFFRKDSFTRGNAALLVSFLNEMQQADLQQDRPLPGLLGQLQHFRKKEKKI